jgi:hypothetical protein
VISKKSAPEVCTVSVALAIVATGAVRMADNSTTGNLTGTAKTGWPL